MDVTKPYEFIRFGAMGRGCLQAIETYSLGRHGGAPRLTQIEGPPGGWYSLRLSVSDGRFASLRASVHHSKPLLIDYCCLGPSSSSRWQHFL